MAVLYVLTESWVVLHGYRGKGFKYPAVDMQPFPWRQKAGRGLFHAKHPSCYGGGGAMRGLPIPPWAARDSFNGPQLSLGAPFGPPAWRPRHGGCGWCFLGGLFWRRA